MEGGGVDADPHEFDFLLQKVVQLEPLLFLEVLHRTETVEHGVLHCESQTASLDASHVLFHTRPALPHPLHFSSHPLSAFTLALEHQVLVVVLDLRESVKDEPVKAFQITFSQESFHSFWLLSTVLWLVLCKVGKEVMLKGVKSEGGTMEGCMSEVGWRCGEGGSAIDLLADCLKSAGVDLEERLFKLTLNILN